MRPRLCTTRVKSKWVSRASRVTRTHKSVASTDKYFIRSRVLDELNRAMKPLTKDMYSLRKTLFEEKREMINRITQLEDDLRNVLSVVTSDPYCHNPKRWMSRSSIGLSSASSLDDINEIPESRSPVMIDVQSLELHLKQEAARSLEDLTQQGGSIHHTKLLRTKTYGNGVETRRNPSDVMSRANRKRWQYSQSVDTGLNLIPSPHKNLRRSNAAYASTTTNVYPMEELWTGSRQQTIDGELGGSMHHTTLPRTKTQTFRNGVETRGNPSEVMSQAQEAPDSRNPPVEIDDTSVAESGELMELDPKAREEDNHGKRVNGILLEAEKDEAKKDRNSLVQRIKNSHAVYSDTYSEICRFVHGGKGRMDSEDFDKITANQEKFLELLLRIESGTSIEADAKIAQHLMEEIAAIYARLQGGDSVNAMGRKKKADDRNSTKPTQNEIPDADTVGRTVCGEMKSNVPAKRKIYYLEHENQDLEIKLMKLPKKEIYKNSANRTKTTNENTNILWKHGAFDLRMILDEKRSRSTNSGDLRDYQNLLANLNKTEEILADFSRDESLKKMRADCQKAINLVLNTISAQCPSHLLDKYTKLSAFLNNETVIISEKPITASVHPLGVLYSLNYLAMKTVKQGEICVSYNPEAAYAIASVVVALWTDMPQYGKLLLSHFYRASPYLIPTKYWERRSTESDEQYHKRLELLYPKNEKEDLNRFLKRHSGIMRLYCAIIVTPQKKSNESKPHPLPLTEAWEWLNSFLTLPPQPDISATVLLDMLEITGHMMATTYNSQLWKILSSINTVYIQSIEQVTPAGRSGPVSRLRAFVEGALAAKSICPPNGLLSPDFW